MTTEIHIDIPEQPTTHRVKLGKETYKARVPKAVNMLNLAKLQSMDEENPEEVEKAMNSLISALFAKADAKKIHKRLEDEGDALDMEHIMELCQKLIETNRSKNPTM